MEILDILNNKYSEDEILNNAKLFIDKLDKIASKEDNEITDEDVDNFKDIQNRLKQQKLNLASASKSIQLEQIESEYKSWVSEAHAKTAGYNTKKYIKNKAYDMVTDFKYGMNMYKKKTN